MTEAYIACTMSTQPLSLYVCLNDDDELCALSFTPHKKASGSKRSSILSIQGQIQEYLDGKRQMFDIPCAYEGTDLQTAVWRKLTTIPYGHTVSYQSIAASVQKPRAWRAVGNAVARNPIAIIIPCHRVLYKQGGIGNYAIRSLGPSGSEVKKALLLVESNTKKGVCK